jgi:hypothetical protein
MFASCWALLSAGLLFALPLILTKVKDHVTLEEDLKFSDETVEDVAATTVLDHQSAATEKFT